jgi:hypothetical protein
MKSTRLKATIPSKTLLGLDDAGNPKRFDLFYSVSNWPEAGDDLSSIFGPDWLDRFAKYEDAHNTKGAARRGGQAFIDAAEAAARAIAPEMSAVECAEALAVDAETYAKIPGGRRKATDDELLALAGWVSEQLAAEPTFTFGPAMTISAATLKKGAEMAAMVRTLTDVQAGAVNAGMAKRGFTAWNLVTDPNPTSEQCAAWLTHRARWDAAQVKADPLAALA